MSTFEPLIGQKFAYSYGRTGVLQQLLLTQSDVDRLLGAHDRNDIEKILTELKLTSMIDQSINKGEDILRILGAWIQNEIEQMSPAGKRPVFSILWLDGDSALLSYLLKKHFNLTAETGKEPKPAMTAYNQDALQTLVQEGKGSALPSALVAFVQKIRGLQSPTPQSIDTLTAQYFATLKLRLARTSGSTLIERYVQHSIDLTNIRIALREYSEEEKSASLLQGGEISTKALSSDKASLLRAVDMSSLPYELSTSITQIGEDPIALERTCSNVLAKDIADMWNIPMSAEPLFAFAAIALSNIFLIRTILIGKGNDLSPQDIKKIMPPFISSSHYRS